MIPQERFPIVKGSKDPWYIQWVFWCWLRPIYIGLPLMLPGGFMLLVLADIPVLIWLLFIRWGGKHKEV